MDMEPCEFDGVCGVLEMFGFFIGKKFYPREVGMSGRNLNQQSSEVRDTF